MQRGRLDARYAIRFPVQLVHGKRVSSLVTEDISAGGVFLGTETPPPLLQLVKLNLVLPIGGRALKVHGMTVHIVHADNARGRAPGMGVQLYGFDLPTREAWDAFARHVEANFPRSADQTPLRLGRGATPEPLQRRFSRHTAVLALEPATIDELADLYAVDVQAGSLFVPTTATPPKGADVVVHIVHPESRAPFLFEAKVLFLDADPPGVHVELRGVDARFRQDFLEFIRGPIAYDSQVMLEPPGYRDPEEGEGELG